jgi:GTP-binding protein
MMNDADMAFVFSEQGRKLFAGPVDFIWAAAQPDGLPPIGPVEIAFAGRSNVGKSSLINALTGRNGLARTSHTPGRTQELNFFSVGTPPHEFLRIVDMPGYGYAAASKQKINAWTDLMRAYLRGRSSLARVYVLIDGRHGLKESDKETLDLLDQSAVSYQIILTKSDAVPIAERAQREQDTLNALARRPAAFPHIIFTSSKDSQGIASLRASIAELLQQRGVILPPLR